jgi:hypothetical protein
MVERTRSVAVGGAEKRSRVEAASKDRGADVYAGFLLPHFRPKMPAGRSLNDALRGHQDVFPRSRLSARFWFVSITNCVAYQNTGIPGLPVHTGSSIVAVLGFGVD